MATGGQKRTRSERVAALELPPSQWERAWESLRRRDVLGRVGLALLAAAAMVCVLRAWAPPFGYHVGDVPSRNIISRVAFETEDPGKTLLAREQAKGRVPYAYEQDPQPLVELRKELRNVVAQLTAAESLERADLKVLELWKGFDLPTPSGASSNEELEEEFRRFRDMFAGPDNLASLDKSLAAALGPFEQRGFLEEPSEVLGKGNPDEILVRPKGKLEPLQVVRITDALLGDKTAIQHALRAEFKQGDAANRLFAWLKDRIPATLKVDIEQTDAARERAAAAVESVMVPYKAGHVLVNATDPKTGERLRLTKEQVDLLRLEHAAVMQQRALKDRLVRGAVMLAMVFVAFVLCGVYMRYRQRGPLDSVTRLLVLILMALATVGLARIVSVDPLRAELIPLMLFGMTMAIVYRQELALVLSTVVALLIALASGHDLFEFVLLIGVTAVAIINLRQIRTRRKLIYVGLLAGGVAALMHLGMALLNDQPLGLFLLMDAGKIGLWAVTAGFLMTGLLPFIEQLFGVLTDLSLLELGDVTHPLLQELVRRAPSTYNHSLTMGSIAEAAADAIGARGLLVRVGAYFHDIGKMLKPGYFAENQGLEGSRHDALAPAMSTLVIIAHIKDGSDLARQYRLPQPIIDLIVEHHGTTLVEYFYDRAHERSQTDPNGDEPDESSFRYPGPKPQTKEAAVLMLADAVESASRTLVDPAPSRIEGLVRSIAERRLHDGQFDESGLTLRELRTIEKSLVMSLTSIYHGRIKYPEQRTA
jgi:hypothetical protein